MFAALAIKNPHPIHQLVFAAFDIDGFAVDQGIGDRLPGALDNSAECRPGNSHVPAGLLMGHSQQIGQSDGLTLINGKANLLQIKHGNASGLEIAYFRTKPDPAFFLWSDHKKFLYEIILKNRKLYITLIFVKTELNADLRIPGKKFHVFIGQDSFHVYFEHIYFA
jgi:hypothetical protein